MALLRNLHLAGGGWNASWGAEEVGGKEMQGPRVASRAHSTLSASPFPSLPVQPQTHPEAESRLGLTKGKVTSPLLT